MERRRALLSNDSAVPCATGFLDGDIAELLVDSRVLCPDEIATVERQLAAKRAGWQDALDRQSRLQRVPLAPVKPAPVQLLVPGFSARPLPVELRNVNNLRFREDGTLVALGYDGNVWLLDDRDGDALEESVRPFFTNRGTFEAPIGMALTPPGFARGPGLFVACKGRVMLFADRDGDGIAEHEEVIASGWAPLTQTHNVDALGVAVAPDGRLFFELGTADCTNA